jgi:hypothetical protein
MPFRLTNAPASFQARMNHILKDLLDKGVFVYIDDNVIYAKIEEIPNKLVKKVLERLVKNDLVHWPEKCVWGEKEVEFLGCILTSQGMRVAEDKIKAIQEWQTPQSLRDVQSFWRFVIFYRPFISEFSKICPLLTESTKGDKTDWKWTPDMEKAFVDFQECFTIAPILTHYSPERQCIVGIHAPEFILGAVISPKGSND